MNTEVKNPVGRPKVYESVAAKQAAYRLRQAEKGMKEERKWVPKVPPAPLPLHSDIIDLTAIPLWRRN